MGHYANASEKEMIEKTKTNKKQIGKSLKHFKEMGIVNDYRFKDGLFEWILNTDDGKYTREEVEKALSIIFDLQRDRREDKEDEERKVPEKFRNYTKAKTLEEKDNRIVGFPIKAIKEGVLRGLSGDAVKVYLVLQAFANEDGVVVENDEELVEYTGVNGDDQEEDLGKIPGK